jgi:aspartyl-tRNA(Asn)/glutamyl-tRNA(Gln) amidotransferase subunit A
MADLVDLTIDQLLAGVEAGSFGAADIVSAFVSRTNALNEQLSAFVASADEAALIRAAELDEARASGISPGPLFGIPIAVKDALDTRSMPTTMGSKVFAANQPVADAHAIERLEAAGAVITGKLNMDELALGVTGTNPLFPPCRNPWNLAAIPGGSSSGCGSALAASLCAGALGTDTAGSVRVPAALCGVAGLKPTFGRVSRRGVIPLSWSLDHVGPMARSVADLARIFEVICGFDDADPFSIPPRTHDAGTDVNRAPNGWRIGLALDGIFGGAAPEVQSAVQAAASVFESLGAHVEPTTLEAPNPGGIITTEAAVLYAEQLRTHPDEFGPRVRAMLETAANRPVAAYALGRRDQVLVQRAFERIFRDVDLILAPTTPTPAPLLSSVDEATVSRDLTRLTGILNLAGVPALTVNAGLSSDGMPIGIQLIGSRGRDEAVLAVGCAFEDAAALPRISPAESALFSTRPS